MRSPRQRFLVLSAFLVAAAVPLGAPAASADTAQQLSAGQAVTLSAPGIYLPPLADGRLHSYGASSDVRGVAFAQQAGTGSEAVSAAAGDELVVLHVSVSWDETVTNGQIPVTADVALSVQSGDQSAPLKVLDTYPDAFDGYFAAAVPVGAPARLSLSVDGLLTQSLDLRSGQRIPPVPAVLYRDRTQPDVVIKSTAVTSFSASSSAGTATGQFGVSQAVLSYWKPLSTTLAPVPGDAYLDVRFAPSQVSIPGFPTDSINPSEFLPTGAVSFVFPDGQKLTATTETSPIQLSDIFSGDYFAIVPSDISSVRVEVDPGNIPVHASNPDSITDQSLDLHFTSPLSATVEFPPAWSAPTEATTVPTTAVSSSPAPARPVHQSGGVGLWLIVVAGAVLLVGGGGWRAFRYRVRVPARPYVWPMPQLSPAATRALSAPTRWALPAGQPTSSDPAEPAALGAAPVIDAPHEPQVTALLLGDLDVYGTLKPIRDEPLRRFFILLLVNPGKRFSAEAVSRAISSKPSAEPKTKTVHTYASRLRSQLPPGLFPDAGGEGYWLDHRDLRVDWLALEEVARDSPSAPGWQERAVEALELIRGRPLQDCFWDGVKDAAESLDVCVEYLARTVAAQFLGAGDPVGAEWALAKGILALPCSLNLWSDRLGAAAAGSGYGLERLWKAAQHKDNLGDDHVHLQDYYDQLRAYLANRRSATI